MTNTRLRPATQYRRKGRRWSGNGVIRYRHSIVAGGGVVAQHTRDSNVSGGNPRTVYTTRDALGSIGMITDQAGAVIGKMHFDPWGKRIDAQDWDGPEQAADVTALRNITHRGFTDHDKARSAAEPRYAGP